MSSGDGGWMHLGVHVAEVLAASEPIAKHAIAPVIEFDDRLLDAVTWIWQHQPQ